MGSLKQEKTKQRCLNAQISSRRASCLLGVDELGNNLRKYLVSSDANAQKAAVPRLKNRHRSAGMGATFEPCSDCLPRRVDGPFDDDSESLRAARSATGMVDGSMGP